MGPVLSLLVGVLIVLAITAFTGWFVAQEFAFMAVDRSRTAARARAGDEAAARTLSVTSRTSFMLSGAQLGITVTGLVVGFAAEPLIGGALADLGSSAGLSSALAAVIGAVVALLFSTVVQMVLGELFPKNYAIARPEQVADRLAPSTLGYLAVLKPLIWVFDRAAEGLLRLLRIEPVHDVEHSATPRDLKHIVEESRESGELPEDLSHMLERALEFPTRRVGHAMIPRARVAVVQADRPIADVRLLMDGGHTRYPVLDGDEVLGVVELLDVLPLPAHETRPVREITRAPFTISAFTTLPDALQAMRAAKARLALVIDEFGGFGGVLSAEDLAEEIVGEIEDEHDADDLTAIERLDGNEEDEGRVAWRCPGATPTDEVERALDVLLPPGDFETVGGAVMAYCGGFVDVGQRVDIPLPLDPGEYVVEDRPAERHLVVEILEVAHLVPRTVRLSLRVNPAPETEGKDA